MNKLMKVFLNTITLVEKVTILQTHYKRYFKRSCHKNGMWCLYLDAIYVIFLISEISQWLQSLDWFIFFLLIDVPGIFLVA